MTNPIVYILDDETDLVQVLGEMATVAGFEPRGFTTGKDFFDQLLLQDTPELLVLDLNMPEMDGIEVIRKLATLPQPPSLILMSGLDLNLLSSVEKLGVEHNLEILGLLKKPVRLQDFFDVLKKHDPSRAGNRPSIKAVGQAISSDELRIAIDSNQLSLHYQPQIDMRTRKIAGLEALVRWHHPERGLLYPDAFIAIAERDDLIGSLTQWVINRVLIDEKTFKDKQLVPKISINISPKDITSLTLPEQLSSLLAGNHLTPDTLVLEMTESSLMGELKTSLDTLARLRLKGIELAIDDFGTGYSSLQQLHRAPFNELKIDQSFVSKMTADSEAKAIVKTCILLAKDLNMRVVAEGVEDQQTWDELSELNCDITQGFFISKPLPLDELRIWLSQQ